jgi:hypothetical protein
MTTPTDPVPGSPPARPFGMFDSAAERDAWVARRDAALAQEAAGLRHIGIADADDLAAKYGELCDLFERTWHGLDLTPEPGDISLTSDEARAAADRVLEIMNGGPWR